MANKKRTYHCGCWHCQPGKIKWRIIRLRLEKKLERIGYYS